MGVLLEVDGICFTLKEKTDSFSRWTTCFTRLTLDSPDEGLLKHSSAASHKAVTCGSCRPLHQQEALIFSDLPLLAATSVIGPLECHRQKVSSRHLPSFASPLEMLSVGSLSDLYLR